MTALAAGASVTVSVRDGGTISIATNGGTGTAVATLNEGGTSTANLGPTAERRVLGPYAEGATVVISNINCNAFDYDVETRADSGVAFQLARSAVAASLTGTVSETALATVTIPAGAMGLNGGLEVRTVWSVTNSANTKTCRVRLGGVSGTAHLSSSLTTSATLHDFRRIRNRGSAASQVCSTAATAASPVGNSGVAVTTSVIDTSVSQDVVISGQLGLGSETITLEAYEVWLLP